MLLVRVMLVLVLRVLGDGVVIEAHRGHPVCEGLLNHSLRSGINRELFLTFVPIIFTLLQYLLGFFL